MDSIWPCLQFHKGRVWDELKHEHFHVMLLLIYHLSALSHLDSALKDCSFEQKQPFPLVSLVWFGWFYSTSGSFRTTSCFSSLERFHLHASVRFINSIVIWTLIVIHQHMFLAGRTNRLIRTLYLSYSLLLLTRFTHIWLGWIVSAALQVFSSEIYLLLFFNFQLLLSLLLIRFVLEKLAGNLHRSGHLRDAVLMLQVKSKICILRIAQLIDRSLKIWSNQIRSERENGWFSGIVSQLKEVVIVFWKCFNQVRVAQV